MDIPHLYLKKEYDRHMDAIARSVNPDLRPDLNYKNFKEAQAAGLASMVKWVEEHQKFLEESIAEHQAKAAVILPDDIDANRAEYNRATLTRQWAGMNPQDIQKQWAQVLKTGDKVAAWVFRQHAPYAIAENMAQAVSTHVTGDGMANRRVRWDGKPYQGKEVLELMDKSLQLAAPDAHKAKERVGQLDREMYDLKIGYGIAKATLEGLKYSDKDGVIEGHNDDARRAMLSGF